MSTPDRTTGACAAGKAIGFALALAHLWPVAASGQRWVSLAPPGGPALGVAFSAAAPETVYAGTAFAGVFRSDDGGSGWAPAGRGLAALTVLTLIASPDDPAVVYAGIATSKNQGSIALSLDGGASWRDATPRPSVNAYTYAFALDPHDRSLLYAATGDGLFRTSFGQTSWSPVFRPRFGSVESIAVDPARGSTLYAGAIDVSILSAKAGVYKSTDSGRSWVNTRENTLHEFFVDLVFDPSAPGTLYALEASEGAVLRTTNGGRTWSSVGPPGDSLLIGVDSALAITPAGTLLVSGFAPSSSAPALWRSVDHGGTWQAAPGGGPPDLLTKIATAPGAASAPAAETLLAAGRLGVWRTSDGGESWRPSSRGLVAQNVASLETAGDGTFYFGVFGRYPGSFNAGSGLFRGLNQGRRLRRLSYSYGETLAVDPLDPLTLYTGSEFNVAAKSTDGGLTWTPVSFPTGRLVIDPTRPATLYTTRQVYSQQDTVCAVQKSVDSGASWSCIAPGFLQGFDALAVDPRRPWIVYGLNGNLGIVMRSDDGGTSWGAASQGLPDTQGSVLAIDPGHPFRLYVATPQGLFGSTDRARSWQALSTSLPAGVTRLIVDGRAPSRLYAGVPGQGIFGSSDGGVTWALLGRGLPGALFAGAFALDRILPATLFAGTGGEGVFRLDLVF